MAIIKSGSSDDHLTINANNAARITMYQGARPINMIGDSCFQASGPLTAFTAAATATDLVVLIGSQNKVVRVYSVFLVTTNTAAGSQAFYLIKRANPNVGGTSVLAQAHPGDQMDGPTATVQHYTANPSTLGNPLGTINIVRVASTILIPSNFAGVSRLPGVELLPWYMNSFTDKPVTLRGQQTLAINYNGAAVVAGQVHQYRIVWTESDK